MTDSPPNDRPKEIRTVDDLKSQLGRLKTLLQGNESYHRRFAMLQNEIDQLKERVSKLEPQNSPPEDSP